MHYIKPFISSSTFSVISYFVVRLIFKIRSRRPAMNPLPLQDQYGSYKLLDFIGNTNLSCVLFICVPRDAFMNHDYHANGLITGNSRKNE